MFKFNNYLIILKNKELISLLGNYLVYNINKDYVISIKKKRKVPLDYFRALLYKVDLSMDRSNRTLGKFAKENVLNSLNIQHYYPEISYLNGDLDSFTIKKEKNYPGEVLTDGADIYVFLENKKAYLLEKVEEYYESLEEGYSKYNPIRVRKIDKLKPYTGRWRDKYYTVIQDILENYYNDNGVEADRWLEKLGDIDYDFSRFFDVELDELERKYNTAKSNVYKIDKKKTIKGRKYSDLEIIIQQELRELLKNYEINKEIIEKLEKNNTIINSLTNSDEITEFVRVVIDSLYGVDSNTKTQLLLSYRKLYKKIIDTSIRKIIRYYKVEVLSIK